MIAAPPKSAAAPIAPVWSGAGALPELVPAAAEAIDVGASVLTEVVAVVTPLVNGSSVAELAPLKAGSWVVAVGLAEAVLLPGFNTPSMT